MRQEGARGTGKQQAKRGLSTCCLSTWWLKVAGMSYGAASCQPMPGRCTSSRARCNCFHTRMHTYICKARCSYRCAQCLSGGKVFLLSCPVSHAHHVTEGDRKVTVAGTLEMVNLELKPSQPTDLQTCRRSNRRTEVETQPQPQSETKTETYTNA